MPWRRGGEEDEGMVKGPGEGMVKRAGEGMAQTGRRRLWRWTDDREEDEPPSPGWW